MSLTLPLPAKSTPKGLAITALVAQLKALDFPEEALNTLASRKKGFSSGQLEKIQDQWETSRNRALKLFESYT